MTVSSWRVETEIRCPTGPRRLLAKMRSNGERPSYVSPGLMELYCRDCTRTARQTEPWTRRVLHRFDLAGELIETVVE